MNQSRREALAAYAFLAPNFLAFLVLVLGPTVFSFVVGFTTWNGLGMPKWSGLQNYVRLVKDPLFVKAVRNTAICRDRVCASRRYLRLGFGSAL